MCNMMKYTSPLGGLTVVEKGGFITVLVLDGQKYSEKHIPEKMAKDAGQQETATLVSARRWLDAYFAGERPDICRLLLAPAGSAFRQQVWRELMEIPYGTTTTYGAIARKLGSSPRAVGAAVGHNPISIIIPCHRVIGADGSLTGYAGGIENKIKLLKHENDALLLAQT